MRKCPMDRAGATGACVRFGLIASPREPRARRSGRRAGDPGGALPGRRPDRFHRTADGAEADARSSASR